MDRIEARLRHEKVEASRVPGTKAASGKIDYVELNLLLSGDLTPEQERQLRAVADRCPVHKALTGEIVIAHR